MGVENDISWSELKEGQDLENRAVKRRGQTVPTTKNSLEYPLSPPGLFLENFRYNFKFYESENFSDSALSIAFSNPKILVFHFLRKIV